MALSAALRRLVVFTASVLALAAFFSVKMLPDSPIWGLLRLVDRHIGTDSSFCMDFGWNAFQAGRQVYESVFFTGLAKFQYPISSLLLYELASRFHMTGSLLIHRLVLVSFVVTILMSCEVFRAAMPAAERLSKSQRVLVWTCILALGLTFYPIVGGATLGQLQTVQVMLWTFVVFFWMRGRPGISGIGVALICMLKPPFVVFLLWGALRRQWRFFAAFLISFLAIQAVSVAVFGWHNEMEYVTVVSHLSRQGEAYYVNQSINGLLQRLIGNADAVNFDLHGFAPYNRAIYLGTTISSGLLLATGLVLPMLRRWRDSTLDLLFFGLLVTVASPIAWSHHYGYFFAAALYMMAKYLFEKHRVPVVFRFSFILLTVPVGAGFLAIGTRVTFLTSFELFAGLGILYSLALLADRRSESQVFGDDEMPVPAASLPVQVSAT